MFSSIKGLALLAVFITSSSAQSCSSSSSPQPYNTVPGYPRSDGCVPTSYTSAYDLGNTNPTDAQTRCQQQCNSQANCAGYIAQLNQSPNGLYSGTCFFYAGSVPKTVRSCADKPTQLVAQSKDFTLQCFSSSSAIASQFCSSYLSIGTVTTYTSTSTPISQATTTSFSTVVTTTTSFTSTATATTTSSIIVDKRAAVRVAAVAPTPACVTSDTPASRISSACSCLSIKSTTQSLVSTARATRTTSVIASTITSTTTVNAVTTTTVSTSTTAIVSSLTRAFNIVLAGEQVGLQDSDHKLVRDNNQSPVSFSLTNGVLSSGSSGTLGFQVATIPNSNIARLDAPSAIAGMGDTAVSCVAQGLVLYCNGMNTDFYSCFGTDGTRITLGFGNGFASCSDLGPAQIRFVG